MVPYAAYLRVYEPADAAPATQPDPHELTRAEQERSRRAAVLAGPGDQAPADSGAVFVLGRDGRMFVAPADERVRAWTALTRLAAGLSTASARALAPGGLLDEAEESLRLWRQQHPDEAPHVREATWRLPLAWLLVPVAGEAEPYRVGGRPTARYLTPMVQARRRVARAHAVARRHFPESDEVAEVVDLGRWLEAFHAHSWVELDLAGLGVSVHALDPDEPDRSLDAVQAAVAALRDGRVQESVERYQNVTVWWGSIALRENAN